MAFTCMRWSDPDRQGRQGHDLGMRGLVLEDLRTAGEKLAIFLIRFDMILGHTTCSSAMTRQFNVLAVSSM